MPRQVHLTRRDLAVLEGLLERRCETLDYLHHEYFSAWQRQSARVRLSRLCTAGYLTRVTEHDPATPDRPEHVYLLGPKARRALELRSLSGEHLRQRRFNPILRETSIPHQLATNRIGDWLGAHTTPEHFLTGRDAAPTSHRPDAVYTAAEADGQGRQLVFLEVDLGNYSRQRLLDKMRGFLAHPDARSIIFAAPNAERLDLVARWLRETYGHDVMQRVQPLTFEQLRRGSEVLDSETTPLTHPDSRPSNPVRASRRGTT